MATISAIICTYERYDLLPKAIGSLAKQTLAYDDFEIIVVDNSPDHAYSAQIAKHFEPIPNLQWIIEKTPGLSNARNVGTRAAKAPIVAFMDDDAIASPGWLKAYVSAFAAFGGSAAVAGGRVDPIWGAPRPKWLHESLLGYVSVVNWGGVARVAADSEWVAGTNIAFRVEPLLSLGGFSVNLGRNRGGHALLSNEEIEVVRRLKDAGGQLVYVPDAVIEHLVPPERLTQAWFRRRVAWQAVSEYLQDSKRLFEAAPRYWSDVTSFYARLAPKYRTPRGLWTEQEDPDMFRRQMSAVYNFTVASLAGFNGLDGAEHA